MRKSNEPDYESKYWYFILFAVAVYILGTCWDGIKLMFNALAVYYGN